MPPPRSTGCAPATGASPPGAARRGGWPIPAADHLRHGSAVLERLITAGGLAVVGAHYDLGSGTVDFFDLPVMLVTGDW